MRKNNKFKIKSNNKILLILIILAFLVNFYLIPDRQIEDNLPRITEGNITYIDLNYFDVQSTVQESIDSGNLNEILWKIIYFGSGRDKLCFQKSGGTDNINVSVSNDFGDFYNLTENKCFKIPKEKNKTTFNLVYNTGITIPDIETGKIVNKSECIFESINESINETCIVNGKPVICHPCYTEQIIVQYGEFPGIKTYFEANLFHKTIKFLFILVLTSIVLKELVETFEFFFVKRK